MRDAKLPDEWLEVEWDHITAIDGFRRGPFGGHLKKTFFKESGYAVYEQYAPINDDCSRFRYFIDEDKYNELSSFRVQSGDFLISCSGTMGRITRVPLDAPDGVINQALLRIRLARHISSDFFLKLFRSPSVQNSVLTSAGGGAIQNLAGVKELKLIKLPLPPLAEQKVIADKLDTQLAQVETTKARLDRIREILKSFRQSVLAAAVSGKLTDEWRGKISCGSAFDYLKTIENERIKLVNAKRLKKSTLPKTAIEQGDSELPKSWALVNFEHIAAYDNHALKAGPFGSALKKSDCTDSGYRVYGQEQVIAGDESLVTYYINEAKFDDLSSCAVDAGDILVSLVGTIGKVLILSEDAERGIINPRLVKLSLQPEVNQKYIQYFLQSTVALDFFKGFSHGGTMDILNLGILKDLPINFPPTEEQTEIVRRVEELFAFANRIEQMANAAIERVNYLTQSILAKAFRGELTADWRKANPALISGENSAEALLKKIKEERELEKKANKGKKKTNRKHKPMKYIQPEIFAENSVVDVINKKGKAKPQEIFDELKELMDLREVLREVSQLLEQEVIKETDMGGQQYLVINR